MSGKQLLFRDDARERMQRGVDLLADAVMLTLGPRGRTVILDSDYGPPQIVNSGVLVARSIELPDRFENMGAQLLREVASRTSEMAGDGTTTAAVLAHAMIREGLRYLAGGMNPMDLGSTLVVTPNDCLMAVSVSTPAGRRRQHPLRRGHLLREPPAIPERR